LNFTKLQIMVYNIQDLEESRFWNRSTWPRIKKGDWCDTRTSHTESRQNLGYGLIQTYINSWLIHVWPHIGRIRDLQVWLWSKWPSYWCYANISHIKSTKILTDKNQLENGTEKNHENCYASQSVVQTRFKPGASQRLVRCIHTWVNLVNVSSVTRPQFTDKLDNKRL
jgi:hypothetical protein